MTYREYQDQRQAEFNALPIFYAFGREQFAEAMQERGLEPTDTDKLYSLAGTGGYYLKTDADQIRAYFNGDRLKELMKDPAFAEDAFYYEMCNHEYGINWDGDHDVCRCFGYCEYDESKDGIDYLEEMGYDEAVKKAYLRAAMRYSKDAEQNEWN